MKRIVRSVSVCAVVLFLPWPALANASRFEDIWSALTGKVILAAPKNTVAIVVCNKTARLIGYELRYAPANGRARSLPLWVESGSCESQSMDKSWFSGGLPADLEIVDVSSGTSAAGTVKVFAGYNGAIFAPRVFCKDGYRPTPDAVNPHISSPSDICISD
jgi:hypothetical protein